jgi:ATP-binding cassette subfamily B protein/subfamily B ATP-binding cassette protein MsbA
VFLGVIVLSNLIRALRDYRQRLINTRVMLALRQSLFDRLLHLPLPKLWDMKTGGILSRLTGDVDTTTGLLQMAIVSPTLSLIRLLIAVVVLLALNWRLALTALAIIPGVVLMSLVFARRVRPIYRAVRKDVELIDGRVGETFSGIRVVRAFRRELREVLDYLRGRHTVLRKELFANRREMVLWTSWGLLLGIVNGHRERAAHSGIHGRAARRANHLRHRPSPLHGAPGRLDPSDGERACHRAWGPRATDASPWCVLRHGSTPDGIYG